jgi:hypothetical protein
MTKKPCWRYKCEFCGRTGYSSFHMRKHESGCTMNPQRICRIHQYADLRIEGSGPFPVPLLQQVLLACQSDEDHGLAALRDAAEDCPCCMFAAIRQLGWHRGEVDEEGYSEPIIKFDFKAELARLWEGVNEKGYERETV